MTRQPAVGGFFGPGRRGLNACGKERQLNLSPVKFGYVLHAKGFAFIAQRLARAFATRQAINLSHRELALCKSVKQGFTHGARCAQYGNIPAFRHGGLLQK